MKNHMFYGSFRPSGARKHIIRLVIALAFLLIGLSVNAKTSQAACADTPDSSKGTATMSVSVPETTKYKVWTRLLVPDSTNNSYFLQIDGGCAIRVGGNSGIAANNWTWVSYKDGSTSSTISVDLTAGQHQLVLTGRDTGVGVDRILFLSDMNCTPTGKGDNCTTSTPPPADTTDPTVTLSAPANNATVSGKNATVTATANDNVGVTGVQFKLDNNNIGNEDTSSPYTISWDTTAVSDGNHTLTAIARDAAGNTKTSSITVNVNNPDTTVPTISFSAPASGATVSGNVTATVNANDDTGVTKVEISLDQQLKMTDTSSPYNYTFDSKTLSNGSHTLSAKAYDSTGNTRTANVSFNVNNPDTTVPAAPANLNATTPNTTTVSLSWDTAIDQGNNPSGISKYNVLRKSPGSSSFSVIAQPTTTSYTDGNRVAGTTYSYIVQAVDKAGNISANSNTVSVTTPSLPTPDTTAPSVPGNVKATAVSTNQVNVSWDKSSDSGGSGLAGYNVYRDGNKLNSSPITTNSYGDSEVTSDHSYSYRIEAVDGAGNTSSKSAEATATTPATVRGDVTGPSSAPDGKIDIRDISYLIRNYNSSNPIGDVSGPGGQPDGTIDIYDLSFVIRNYGE